MDLDSLLTGPEAARSSLKITEDMVRTWRARGFITPSRYRGRQPLYRWVDLLRAEQRTRSQTGKSHRRVAA